MADPRTSGVIEQMMSQMAGARDAAASMDAENASESDKKMMESMMFGMPLKSLVSFGVMSLEQMDGMIAMLNATIANYQS